jgi:hypothetical protein
MQQAHPRGFTDEVAVWDHPQHCLRISAQEGRGDSTLWLLLSQHTVGEREGSTPIPTPREAVEADDNDSTEADTGDRELLALFAYTSGTSGPGTRWDVGARM